MKNVIALRRSTGQAYMFLFDDNLHSLGVVLDTIARWSADSRLDLTAADAAMLAINCETILKRLAEIQ